MRTIQTFPPETKAARKTLSMAMKTFQVVEQGARGSCVLGVRKQQDFREARVIN